MARSVFIENWGTKTQKKLKKFTVFSKEVTVPKRKKRSNKKINKPVVNESNIQVRTKL